MAIASRLRGVPTSGRAVAGQPIELSLRCCDATGNACRDARGVRARALIRPLPAGSLSLGGPPASPPASLPASLPAWAASHYTPPPPGPPPPPPPAVTASTTEAVVGADGELILRLRPLRAQAYEVT